MLAAAWAGKGSGSSALRWHCPARRRDQLKRAFPIAGCPMLPQWIGLSMGLPLTSGKMLEAVERKGSGLQFSRGSGWTVQATSSCRGGRAQPGSSALPQYPAHGAGGGCCCCLCLCRHWVLQRGEEFAGDKSDGKESRRGLVRRLWRPGDVQEQRLRALPPACWERVGSGCSYRHVLDGQEQQKTTQK